MRYRSMLWLVLLAMAWIGLGCGATHVRDIRQDLDHYKDQPVSLRGEVVETLALPFIHKGAYQLDDGTGKVWVIPKGDVPARGAHVEVTGTVRTGVEIAGMHLGIVLTEGE